MKLEKRVGVIDNLNNIDEFRARQIHCSDAKQWMHATGGNTGNVAFAFGTQLLFKNSIVRVGWGWSPDVVRARVDHLVIACANQLGSHADLSVWASRLEAFDLPVTLIGLGAQTENYETNINIPSGTIRFLQTVSKLKPRTCAINVGVRGSFTKNAMLDLGFNATITACPSLLISDQRDLGCKISHRVLSGSEQRIVVAAGNPWHEKTAFLEKRLIDIVNGYHGAYVLQHPESVIQLSVGDIDCLSEDAIQRFMSVLGFSCRQDMLNWFRHNSYLFADSPSWMLFMSKFDGVIGPRFHGVALGIQAGIPGLVICIDNRTKELSETCGMPYVLASDMATLSANEMANKISWSEVEGKYFDSKRREIASNVKCFIEDNELLPSDHLTALCSNPEQGHLT